MSNRSSHFANRFQTMISAIRAAPLRVLFLAVAVAVVGLMTVTDLPSASPVHAQEQAVTATRNATGESPPARPTDLQASAKHDSVSLTWTASTDQTVTHYAVLRRDRDKADAGVFKVIDGNAGSATSYTDRSVSPEDSYVYRVKAVSPTGVSQWSSYARADIPTEEDLAPSGLSAKVVSGDDGVIEGVALAWVAPAADAASVTGYEILRAVGDGDLATLAADTGSAGTTYADGTATEAGESYAYRVKALRGEEASQPSDRAEVIIPKVTAVPVEPPIAEEQNVHVEVWSAALFPDDIEGSLGCSNSNLVTCSAIDVLTDDDFDYDGASYTVTTITLAIDGTLEIDVSATPTDATIADLVLNVDTSNVFRLSDATVTGSTLSWASTGLTWTEGRGVVLTLNAGNRPPLFTSTSALREVPENSPAGTDVGAPVTAVDPDGDTLTYTLEGTDAASFGIGSSTGQIQTISGVTYDFESDNTYFVTVKADDGNGGTETIFVGISLTDEDELAAVWSATLTPRAAGSDLGCFDETGSPCTNTANLSDNQFTYDSTDYTVHDFFLQSGDLEINIGANPTAATLADLTLSLDETSLALSAATVSASVLTWSNTGLSWTAGTDVAVSLAEAAAAPGVSSVEVTSEPGDDDTYAIGDTIQVTVTFDQAVTVTGAPRIQLRVGGGEDEHLKWADYRTGTGADAVVFEYVVLADDFDDNGIYIAADELELNGGTIQSSGGTDANLDYPLQGGQSGHNVDGVRPTPQSAATSLDGSSVIIIFSEPLSETTAPASAFMVGVDTGTAPAVSTATASGNLLTLGLASALTSDQVVTVTYTDATAGNDSAAVQDAAGNDADTFTQTVSNAVGTGCPGVAGCYVVSADWGLIPTGLGAGAAFRLIFISSGTHNASSSNIADYNTFVQTTAASGHADIQVFSSTFRVVGSTADVDARDNTDTTYTADDKGVAIYWLGGNKVVDDYEDFYDGGWDDEANAKDESGSNRSISGVQNAVYTGSDHDGTGSTLPLGNGTVRLGQPNTSGHGPLSSGSSISNHGSRPFYGLSPVFRVASQVVTNTAPVFTTAAVFSVDEGTTGVLVMAMDADDGDEVTYAITGGEDQAQFSIGGTSGLLASLTLRDYENPTDADGNNVYLVTVTATGGTGARALTTDQAITVTVNDVDEPPSFPAAPTVSAVDGSSDSLSVTWTAPGNSGKPDIESYDLQYRKGTTGNYIDGPQDVTDTTTIIGVLDADSLYQVQVRATNDEGDSLWSSAGTGTTNALAGLCLLPTGPLWSACLTVGEIDSAGRYGYQASNSTGSLAPATFDVGTTTYTVTHLFDNDNVGGTTYVRIILSPILSQDDAGNLTLHLGDGTSFSFGDATYSTGTGISRHLWTLSAALGWSTGETIVVGITQEEQANTAPAFTTVANFSTNENQAATFQVTAMDPDDGDEVTYAITGGADQAKFDIDASSGVLTFKDAPDHENPTDADSNNVYLVTVTATGGTGARALTADQAITVTVTALDEIWSATMTVGVNSTLLGWDDAGNYTGAALSDEDFDYGGDTYNLSVIRLASGSLIVIFNDTGAGDLATNATRDKITLHVDGTTFNFGAGDLNSAQTGVAWSATAASPGATATRWSSRSPFRRTPRSPSPPTRAPTTPTPSATPSRRRRPSARR